MNQHIAENTIGALQDHLRKHLITKFDERESSQLVKILFFDLFNLNSVDLISKKQDRLSESEILKLHFALKRLLQDEPIQYVTGLSYFCGLKLNVNSSTLIPRPETEELVLLAMECVTSESCSVLDIGTGSGCIALALKKNRPNWSVRACDVSRDALLTAKRNAGKNSLDVIFFELDVLKADKLEQHYDLIISNPPYIPITEKNTLPENVLGFEPHLALFVEDDNPLLFYKKILNLASKHLNPKGVVLFEIHESLSKEMIQLKKFFPIENIDIHHDMQDKPRMAKITFQ